MLESLARVFGLDATATQYLLSLTSARPRPARPPRRETVPAGILQLLDALELPAFVENRMFAADWLGPIGAAFLTAAVVVTALSRPARRPIEAPGRVDAAVTR